MIIKNCKACGTKLVVVKTLVGSPGIKRIKHCTKCDTSLTSIEIHMGLYETLMRSHKEIEKQGLLSTVAPVSQDAAQSQAAEPVSGHATEAMDALMRKLLPSGGNTE